MVFSSTESGVLRAEVCARKPTCCGTDELSARSPTCRVQQSNGLLHDARCDDFTHCIEAYTNNLVRMPFKYALLPPIHPSTHPLYIFLPPFPAIPPLSPLPFICLSFSSLSPIHPHSLTLTLFLPLFSPHLWRSEVTNVQFLDAATVATASQDGKTRLWSMGGDKVEEKEIVTVHIPCIPCTQQLPPASHPDVHHCIIMALETCLPFTADSILLRT